MLASVRAEANSNHAILDISYGQYFDTGGVVLKDFSVVVVSQSLTNPLFVKHLKPADLSLLNEYMRTLTLANSYRHVTESLTFRSSGKEADLWKDTIMNVWRPTVDEEWTKTEAVEKVK